MANILVLDDEPILLDLISTTLLLEGHNVTTLSGVEELGPDQRNLEAIDLLVTDVNMQPVSGYESLNRLREWGFKGAVLFMSGCFNLSKRAAGVPHRSEMLEKPFTAAQLRSAVQNALVSSCRTVPSSHLG